MPTLFITTQATPFDFDDFCAGRPAITRNGRKAHFVAYISYETDPDYDDYDRLIVRLEGDPSGGSAATYSSSGSYFDSGKSSFDLVGMEPQNDRYHAVKLLATFPTQKEAEEDIEERELKHKKDVFLFTI
jgi:hypothetical protein